MGNVNLDKQNNDSELLPRYPVKLEFIWNGKVLDTKCLKQNLYELTKSRPTSLRLRHFFDRYFKEESFPCRTIEDILVGGEKVFDALMRYPNVGRTSIKELKKFVESFLLEQCEDQHESSKYKGITEIIHTLCEQLTPKEQQILSYHYGFNDNNTLTLEEIGNLIGISRQRVCQIETKAIYKISYKSHLSQILNALLRDQMRIFDSLADANGVVWKAWMTKLPGEYRLAFEITHQSFSAWINTVAVEFSKGWLRADLFTTAFKECQQNVKDLLSDLILPTPLAMVTKILKQDTDLVKLCVSLLDGAYLFEGMIFSSNPGRRKKRQAYLYRLLQNTLCQQLEQFVENHNNSFKAAQCSTRDAQIVMAEASHLFLSLNDYGWTALGQNVSPYLTEKNIVGEMFSSIDSEDNESNEEALVNIVAALKQVLKEHGPLHFVPLRELFIESFGHIYAPTSVGPVLLTYKDFVRLAPGVHGLKSHLTSEVLSSCKELLLSEADCTYYVLSRWAGEQIHSYPCWNPEMEYEWYKWAQRLQNGLLFSSLMAVAEPSNWPVKYEVVRHWLEIKKKKAHYCLQFPHKHSLSACVPTIRALYSIIVVAIDQSSMNWIRVNRVLGRRINDQHAATYLAMLIALEVLQPTDHWQLPHLPGKRLLQLAKELSFELCKQGNIPWSNDLGKFLLHNMRHTNCHSNLGWVNEEELDALLELLASDKLGGMKSDRSDNGQEPIDYILEIMMAEQEQNKKYDRIADMIDELMKDGY